MAITIEGLKELLIAPGHVKESDFQEIEKETEDPYEAKKILVRKGLIAPENLGSIVADAIGYPFVDLRKANITPRMLEFIPENVAKSQKAIVFEETPDGVLRVATPRPENHEFISFLEKKTERKIEIHYSTPTAIEAAIKAYEGGVVSEIQNLVKEFQEGGEGKEEVVVKMVDLILERAFMSSASDIHLEPLSKKVAIRFRIDGVLNKIVDYPKEMHPKIVSRIKILSHLRTDEHEAPQDGRFTFRKNDVAFHNRVSTMPITEGEKVVLRILLEEGQRFFMDELGASEKDFKKLQRAANQSYGTILAVGPTGSGKTTTIYAILQHLNNPEVNIMTIEDPVEYNIEGAHQTQVNLPKEVTFAKGLRSIVRQDPDIIMVGEIRDKETADIAVNSAMTGHLVLSTMHTNDAATTFPRLFEMGIESFLVASSINFIIAQRLVRTLCKKCMKSKFLSENEISIIGEDESLVALIKKVSGKEDLSKIRFYEGEGCSACHGTGFFGRHAIFEVLEVKESIRMLIARSASSDEIEQKAKEEGMTSLLHDAIEKALMGTTSIFEAIKAAKSS